MKRILQEGTGCRLIQEVLSDGSEVYNVEVMATNAGDECVRVLCTSKEKAEFLFGWLNDDANIVGVEGW